MGKALLGTYTTPRSIELLDEVRALRRRVAELESALAEAEAAAARSEVRIVIDDVEPATT
jgi:hypothetical protein